MITKFATHQRTGRPNLICLYWYTSYVVCEPETQVLIVAKLAFSLTLNIVQIYTIPKFRFIDLFSGVGGFHQAMSSLGGECVLASDIDRRCNLVYETNYGIRPVTDIRNIAAEDVPDHDVLCAGFPCQPFSKGGSREGFADTTRGTLFYEILRIAEHKKPRYLILENVPNFVGHDSGNTWRTAIASIREIGYIVSNIPIIISPHNLPEAMGGAPQRRERVYILAQHSKYASSELTASDIQTQLQGMSVEKWDFANWLNVHRGSDSADKKYALSANEKQWLLAWGHILSKTGKGFSGGFPLWEKEFRVSARKKDLPDWKVKFHEKNRDYYKANRVKIDSWRKSRNIVAFPDSKRKLEWNVGTQYKGGANGIFHYLIQFRPSGIRIKAPNYVGTLVASVQTPIIGWEKRYLTPGEAGQLQGFPPTFKRDENDKAAYKQFGNSVNVAVVTLVAKGLLRFGTDGILS